MKRLLIILLLAVQFAAAQPTIDGTITAGEGYALVYQNLSSNMGFGTGNQLGALYYSYRSAPTPTLYIGITGRINDANNIVLFLDFDSYNGRGTSTMAGATSSSLGVFSTSGSTSCGTTGGGIQGARMSTGFDADYIFAFNRGNGSSTLFADVMRLSTNAPPIDGYMEHSNINAGGMPNQSGDAANLTLPFNAVPCANPPASMRLAFRNNYDPASNPNSGIEFALSVAGMCGVAEGDFVRFFVAITNQSGEFSNVTIPALPPGTTNRGCNPDLSGFANLFTSFYVLPFQFSDVAAAPAAGGVRLSWSLSGNTAIKNIEVQHSTNGVAFTSVGSVTPVKADGKAAYSYLHRQPAAGVNFYRIKASDAQGNSALSGTVRLTQQQQTGKPVLFPNPVTSNQVRIHTGQLNRGTYQLRMLAADGRELFRRQIVHDGVQPLWQFDCPVVLPPGVYWVHIAGNGGGEHYSLKLIKQ